MEIEMKLKSTGVFWFLPIWNPGSQCLFSWPVDWRKIK